MLSLAITSQFEEIHAEHAEDAENNLFKPSANSVPPLAG